jgi:hypothetical protein
MKPNTAAQLRKEEDLKRRRTAERWRKWIEELRRRQQRQERDRRRRWLIALLLALIESKPVQMFFPVHFAAADPPQQKRPPKAPRKSQKKDEFDNRDDPLDEYDRRYLSDYSTRYGEENQEVYDGLTHEDIVAYNRVHRPWLFPVFKPVPGMPKRYADEPAHVWTLLFEMQYPHARDEAIAALKLIVDPSSHDWISACAKGVGDLTWKDLRKCRSRTPDATLYEFPRYAERWREEQRREAEERKREAKEAPESDPKPPGLD